MATARDSLFQAAAHQARQKDSRPAVLWRRNPPDRTRLPGGCGGAIKRLKK